MRVLSSILFFSFYSLFLIGQSQTGFFDFEVKDGKVLMTIPEDKLDFEFLYVNSLAAGLGSNDIGLDRGQLGSTRIVKFVKAGNKLLLVQPNMDYRAVSDNAAEVKSVQEAFAQSVIWGFKIEKEGHIDLSPFLLRDAHGVTARLKRSKQGTYKLDASRSAIWAEGTKNFPKNSEFESILTFTGQPQGQYLRSVAPDAQSVSVNQHHSFIELPDDQYEPRVFHPYSGYGSTSYMDYATPIYEPMTKSFINRHRLEKKNPAAARSEAVEPIVYYLDSGCPEPVKSALLEGARWWNQAYEAAGFINAFQVKVLPEDVDPLDVRYNVIQWVHRSTRGWSYGASVRDPRTGEIIKGHVSLGSLRVRQDFMIAQGLLSPYGTSDNNHDDMMELALARLRQLSAHEVGHTIGLSHNFASSVDGRASVMDYPHPLFGLDADGNIDLSDAYDVGIGDWDKRAIIYGYQEFSEEQDEEAELLKIISETQSQGLHFISDRDSRPAGGAHPQGHLWDNGADPIDELTRLNKIRKNALQRFGKNTIRNGTALAELEKVLVPLYLMPRYQIEAVSKLIGGVEYNYAVKGDNLTHGVKAVSQAKQDQALSAMLNLIDPSYLAMPKHITELIPPYPHGVNRTRESFESHTGLGFDPIAAAEGLSNHVLTFLLHPQRIARIVRESGNNKTSQYLSKISGVVFGMTESDSYKQDIHLSTQKVYFQKLIDLAMNSGIDAQVSAYALNEITDILDSKSTSSGANAYSVLKSYLNKLYQKAMNNPDEYKAPAIADMPPGSPIGCGETGFHSH